MSYSALSARRLRLAGWSGRRARPAASAATSPGPSHRPAAAGRLGVGSTPSPAAKMSARSCSHFARSPGGNSSASAAANPAECGLAVLGMRNRRAVPVGPERGRPPAPLARWRGRIVRPVDQSGRDARRSGRSRSCPIQSIDSPTPTTAHTAAHWPAKSRFQNDHVPVAGGGPGGVEQLVPVQPGRHRLQRGELAGQRVAAAQRVQVRVFVFAGGHGTPSFWRNKSSPRANRR